MKKLIGLLIMVGFVLCLNTISKAADRDLVSELGVAYHTQDWVGLETFCKTALKTTLSISNQIAAQLFLGVALDNQKRYTESITEYDILINLCVGNMNTNVYLASAYLNKGFALEALNRLTDAQAVFKKGLIIKDGQPGSLSIILGRIDFTEMTQDDADALLLKAYRSVTNKQAKDKETPPNYIYADYLGALASNMSIKAQANLIK